MASATAARMNRAFQRITAEPPLTWVAKCHLDARTKAPYGVCRITLSGESMRRHEGWVMRVEGSVGAISWIPSEAIEAMPKLPFELGIGKYDDPRPTGSPRATSSGCLDGVLKVEVDGEQVAEMGSGRCSANARHSRKGRAPRRCERSRSRGSQSFRQSSSRLTSSKRWRQAGVPRNRLPSGGPRAGGIPAQAEIRHGKAATRLRSSWSRA